MPSLNLKSIPLLLALLALSACGKVDDMHDATMKMDSTTTKMDDKMGNMNDKMADMDTKMDVMTDLKTIMIDLKTEMTDLKTVMVDKITHMDGSVTTGMNNVVDGMKTMGGQVTDMKGAVVTGMNNVVGGMNTMGGQVTDMKGAVVTGMSNVVGGMKTMGGQVTALTTTITPTLSKVSDGMDKVVGSVGEMKETVSTGMGSVVTGMGTMGGQVTALTTTITPTLNKVSDGIDKVVGSVNDMKGDVDKLSDSITVDIVPRIKNMDYTLNLTHSDLGIIFTGQHRMETLDEIDKSDDQTVKLGYAAEYMISQTYQSWNSTIDPMDRRLSRMAEAADDFAYKVKAFMPNFDDVSPSKRDSQSKSRYAIAAALDYVNDIELDGLKGSSAPVESMLSIIEEGLRQRASANADTADKTTMPKYQQKVLDHQAEYIYLLQVRMNFMKGIAYTLLTDHDSGDQRSMMGTIYDVIRSRLLRKSVEAEDQVSVNQIELAAVALDAAAETEKFLAEIGVKPNNSKNVAELLSHLDLASVSNLSSGPEYTHLQNALGSVIELDNHNQ
jgi:hypothetical protein